MTHKIRLQIITFLTKFEICNTVCYKIWNAFKNIKSLNFNKTNTQTVSFQFLRRWKKLENLPVYNISIKYIQHGIIPFSRLSGFFFKYNYFTDIVIFDFFYWQTF